MAASPTSSSEPVAKMASCPHTGESRKRYSWLFALLAAPSGPPSPDTPSSGRPDEREAKKCSPGNRLRLTQFPFVARSGSPSRVDLAQRDQQWSERVRPPNQVNLGHFPGIWQRQWARPADPPLRDLETWRGPSGPGTKGMFTGSLLRPFRSPPPPAWEGTCCRHSVGLLFLAVSLLRQLSSGSHFFPPAYQGCYVRELEELHVSEAIRFQLTRAEF